MSLPDPRRRGRHRGRIRVGIDVTPLVGPGAITGIGRFVDHLVRGLREHHDDRIEVVPFAMTARGVGSVATSQRAPLPARPARAVWERVDHPSIERWTGRLDVVHGTNYVVPPSRGARLVSVHDLTAIRFPEMCTADVVRMPRLLGRAIAGGAHVHTDSEFVGAEVRSLLGAPVERVHTIHLGVDLPPTVRRPSAGDESAFVLAVGTIEPRKAYPTLLRAFEQISRHRDVPTDLRLVIAGNDGWGSSAFDRALAELPVEIASRVIRERSIDDRRRDELLATCACFVYPSLYEGFGLPPLEAMAAGRPVVATTAGSLPEILGDAAVLVAPDDASALADAMLSVLTNPVVAADLVDRGARRVELFRWDRTVSELVELYERLGAA